MILGRVLGPVWSSTQEEHFEGLSLKVVQPVDPEGQPHGSSIVAADSVAAAPDDIVIVVYEGGSARQVVQRPKGCCEAVIVGIVDRIDTVEER